MAACFGFDANPFTCMHVPCCMLPAKQPTRRSQNEAGRLRGPCTKVCGSSPKVMQDGQFLLCGARFVLESGDPDRKSGKALSGCLQTIVERCSLLSSLQIHLPFPIIMCGSLNTLIFLFPRPSPLTRSRARVRRILHPSDRDGKRHTEDSNWPCVQALVAVSPCTPTAQVHRASRTSAASALRRGPRTRRQPQIIQRPRVCEHNKQAKPSQAGEDMHCTALQQRTPSQAFHSNTIAQTHALDECTQPRSPGAIIAPILRWLSCSSTEGFQTFVAIVV